jgi:hypothetical protein
MRLLKYRVPVRKLCHKYVKATRIFSLNGEMEKK